MIIKGVAFQYQKKGNHIITSSIEHKSILESCKFLEKNGFDVTYIHPTSSGYINPDDVLKAITPSTILISLIWANNETGIKNEISQIGKIARNHKILFHTDATQIMGKEVIKLSDLPIDFLSMSGHKIKGPKGTGIAYVGNNDLGIRHKIMPLIHGGSQEGKLRAGTESLPNIVGLAKAIELLQLNLIKNINRLTDLEMELTKEIKKQIQNAIFIGDQSKKTPGIISISVPGINNEILLKYVSNEYALSTGSACNVSEPSHVMLALDIIPHEVIRISFSYDSKFDVTEFVTFLYKNIVLSQ